MRCIALRRRRRKMMSWAATMRRRINKEVEVTLWCHQGQKLTRSLPRRKTYMGTYNKEEEALYIEEDGIPRN